jgi:Exostosin family
MKVWFTATAKGQHPHAAEHLLVLAKESMKSEFNTRYYLAESPKDADVIVYVEPWYIKLREYIYTLLSEELITKYPNRCFVIDCADTSWELMPGVYTGLRLFQANRKRFRSGGYLTEYNPICEKVYEEKKDIEPQLLFSFRGAASSSVRKKIFEASFSGSNISIQQINQWCNHSIDEKLLYAEEIVNSKFVLCPGGNCPASVRLFETMKMGRVPVILSDEWVAPEGPSWQDFSIQVSESRVHELPEIIKTYEPYAFTMGKLARQAWENWFSPDLIYIRMLNYIESIYLARDINHDEQKYQKEWLSCKFQWERGWTPPQRLFGKLQRNLTKLTQSAKPAV